MGVLQHSSHIVLRIGLARWLEVGLLPPAFSIVSVFLYFHIIRLSPTSDSTFTILPRTSSNSLPSIARPVWPATSLWALCGRDFDVAAIRRRLVGTFAIELRRRALAHQT